MLIGRIKLKLECTVNYLKGSLESAKFAYAVSRTREDIEIVALAMRTCAFLALPLGIVHILCCFNEITCDLLHSLDLVILHDDIL